MATTTTSSSTPSSSSASSTNPIMPVFFMSHYGGPNFYMDQRRHGEMWAACDSNSEAANQFRKMRELYGLTDTPGAKYGKPKAILMVSAHWITDKEVRITSQSKHPALFYDFGGFGIDLDEVQYPAPGNPQLAKEISELLASHGIASSLDTRRNFDHGAYNVLHVFFPNADIPVLQLSILSHYNPKVHIELGKALYELRKRGVLIVGSGELTHNFAPTNKKHNLEFASAVCEALEDKSVSNESRIDTFIRWEKFPHARTAHAQEDHFVPIFVTLGAAQGASARRIWKDEMGMGSRHFVVDCYMWE